MTTQTLPSTTAVTPRFIADLFAKYGIIPSPGTTFAVTWPLGRRYGCALGALWREYACTAWDGCSAKTSEALATLAAAGWPRPWLIGITYGFDGADWVLDSLPLTLAQHDGAAARAQFTRGFWLGKRVRGLIEARAHDDAARISGA